MATNKFDEVFMTLVDEAVTAAKGIPEAAKKAEVLARLAQAVATTGLVKGDSEAKSEPPAKTQKPKNMGSEDKAAMEHAKAEAEPPAGKKPDAKEALKQKPDKTAGAKEKAGLPKLPKKMDKKWTTEWTEEALEAFSDELDKLSEKAELYGEDLNEVVKAFSEGKYSSPEDLNPLNIHAFMVYLESLEAEDDEEATSAG